jgi:hypothetical protein
MVLDVKWKVQLTRFCVRTERILYLWLRVFVYLRLDIEFSWFPFDMVSDFECSLRSNGYF